MARKRRSPLEVSQELHRNGHQELALDVLVASGYTKRAARRALLGA